MKTFWTLLLVAVITQSAFSQKVKIGFDKSMDFTQYHTYSWPKPADAPEMTLRRLLVIGEIDHVLQSKGLTRVDDGGNLILSGTGGFGGEMGGGSADAILPSHSYSTFTSMWTGDAAAPASAILHGSLMLQMVERSSDKLVWQGTVTQKIDMDNKQKTIERIKAAIVKLVQQYPPKK
jgi:hypothetical protein